MNWIQIGVIALIIVFGIIGYMQGFVRMGFSMVSTVLIVVLSYSLTPTASSLISETEVYSGIKEQIQSYIDNYIDEENTQVGQIGLTAQTEMIDQLPLPESLKTTLVENNNEDSYKQLNVETFKEYITQSLTHMLTNAFTFLVLFIVLSIIIRVIIALLDIVSRLPIINFLNRTAGTALGAAESIVIIWIASIVITFFGTSAFGEYVFYQINESAFLGFLYNNNLILKIITSIFS